MVIPSENVASLAFFGGTFDPIHLGHLHLARTVLSSFGFNRVFFVPTGQNPLKSRGPAADAHSRWEMVTLALKEFQEPAFVSLDWEIRSPGPSFTIATVEKMRQSFGGPVTLILGNEVFLDLKHWKEPKLLLESADFIVATRVPDLKVAAVDLLRELGLRDITQHGNTMLHSGGERKIVFFQISPLPYSATAIREEIKKRWEFNQLSDPPQGIQRSVWQFIKENRLYAVNMK